MAGSKSLAARKYGRAVGEAFHARLADIWAARNVAELPLFMPIQDSLDSFMLPLAEGFVMVLASNHAADREGRVAKQIGWDKVARVQLLEVKFNG